MRSRKTAGMPKAANVIRPRLKSLCRSVFVALAVLICNTFATAKWLSTSSVSNSHLVIPKELSDERLKTDVSSIEKCKNILESSSLQWDTGRITTRERVLVIYHLGFLTPEDSFEHNARNVRTFMSSLHLNDLFNSTFIIINISGGMYNPLKKVVDEYSLPPKLSCTLLWSHTKVDLLTHALTLRVLYGRLRRNFGAFMFLNNGARGPMVKRREWVNEFLDRMDEVSLTGAILSCEIQPHVPLHAFAFTVDLLDIFLDIQLRSYESETWEQIIRNCEVGFSQAVIESGRKIGSLLHKNRWNEPYFNGTCRPELGKVNVSLYCEPFYVDSIFLKYGGTFYRLGLFCASVLSDVEATTSQLLSL